MIFSSVAPWLDRPEEDPQFKKNIGDRVSFVCPAQGFPLEVEWKVQKIEGAPTCISEGGKLISIVFWRMLVYQWS